mmetsp:Transcript_80833/g.224926  ORF Transcript_80833/g.224926 Transcript_80833/m.224926 type:complete len:214 (+) Transcript_80833:579-1220(+)
MLLEGADNDVETGATLKVNANDSLVRETIAQQRAEQPMSASEVENRLNRAHLVCLDSKGRGLLEALRSLEELLHAERIRIRRDDGLEDLSKLWRGLHETCGVGEDQIAQPLIQGRHHDIGIQSRGLHGKLVEACQCGGPRGHSRRGRRSFPLRSGSSLSSGPCTLPPQDARALACQEFPRAVAHLTMRGFLALPSRAANTVTFPADRELWFRL